LLWHMPVIPATPEAETKKITSSRPIWMTQWDPVSENKTKRLSSFAYDLPPYSVFNLCFFSLFPSSFQERNDF
jgi:hypothetical protein